MINKRPTSNLRKNILNSAKVVVAVEFVVVAGAFVLWQRMNTSQGMSLSILNVGIRPLTHRSVTEISNVFDFVSFFA